MKNLKNLKFESAQKIIVNKEGIHSSDVAYFDKIQTTDSGCIIESVEKCKKFYTALMNMNIAGVNKSIGSYGLKHVVEHAFDTYISNGEAIFAAIELGLDVRVYQDGYDIDGPNVKIKFIGGHSYNYDVVKNKDGTVSMKNFY